MAEEEKKIEAAALEKARPGDTATEIGFLTGEGFALLQRAAKMFSESTLVPKEFQGNIANCAIGLNIANRLKADPLMVMQNLYIVHGRPGWSAQFLIATLNQGGSFRKLRYEWKGEPGTPEWGCRAWTTERETGEKLYGSWITWALANKEGWVDKNGSKWKTMPEQMFMYRAGAWFVRAYAPEIAMGLPTAEEIRDTIDLEPNEAGEYEMRPDSWTEEEKPITNGADKAADALSRLPVTPPIPEDPAEPESSPEPESDASTGARGAMLDLWAVKTEGLGQADLKKIKDKLELLGGARLIEKVKYEKIPAVIEYLRSL